jgi:streptogramin lyase
MATIRQSEGSDRPLRPAVHRHRGRLAILAITVAIAVVGAIVVFARGGSGTASTKNVVATLRVNGRPNGLVAGSGALWVSLIYPKRATSKVERLDLATGAVRRTVSIKGIASFTIRARDSLWVGVNRDFADNGPGSFQQLNWKTGAIEEVLPFDRPVFGAAYGGGSLWFVVGRAPATLLRVDPRTAREVGKPIQLAQSRVIGLAYGAGAVWATALEEGKLIRVDPKTRRVTTVKVGDGPVGVLVSGGRVWVANRSSGTVSRLDAKTMHETGHRTRVGTYPTWIASSAASIWVSNQSDGTVTRIDENTGKVIGSPIRIATPQDDAAAHVMSAADGSLWVASATEQTLSRIDPGP